ncbi:Hypothetical predicted protein [Mytilus galloprovincialis]|uniref:Apple domain-containing protein n=1 Tax=Mytilus galloprovincialis TaxID=29158 RepID=A0A8B6F791_MYTGA|nr:Hypothetical predicted protein [Mytilus galloprovincialis]
MDEFYVLNFLFINVITSVADMQLMFFDVYKNQKISSNYQMHRTFYLSSKEECAILCLNTLTCWSASYRRSTGECGPSSRSARSEPNTTQYDPEWIILNRNVECYDKWIPDGDSCYLVSDVGVTWKEAELENREKERKETESIDRDGAKKKSEEREEDEREKRGEQTCEEKNRRRSTGEKREKAVRGAE